MALAIADPAPAPAGAPTNVPIGARLAAYAVLLVSSTVVVAAYAPGQVNADTLAQLQQIDEGAYNDWFSPLLDKLWSIPYSFGIELAGVLVAQVATLITGLYLIARYFLRHIAAAFSAGLVLLSPPVVSLVGLLGRDVWFAALILFASGCLVRAATSPGRRFLLWTALSVLGLVLASAARQNSVPMTVVLGAVAAAIVLDRIGRLSRRPLVATLTSVAIGLVIGAAILGTIRLSHAALDVYPLHPEQMTFTWDLASLSVREDRVLFPPTIYPAQDLGTIERAFKPDNLWGLILPPEDPHLKLTTTGIPLSDTRYDALRDAWWSSITSNPGEYVAGRVELWLRLVNLTAPPQSVAHYDWSGNNEGYVHWIPELTATMRDYVAVFTSPAPGLESGDPFARGSAVFVVFVYLLIALLLGALFAWRGMRSGKLGLVALGGLLLGAVAYEVVLAVSLPGARYRWSYPLVVAALAVAAPALAAWGYARFAGRRVGAATPGGQAPRGGAANGAPSGDHG